jgi:hypothetical protein
MILSSDGFHTDGDLYPEPLDYAQDRLVEGAVT